MTKKIIILAALGFLFLYVLWNFVAQGILYSPVPKESAGKVQKEAPSKPEELPRAEYWSGDIFERNLFNPGRTYKEPVSAESLLPPPKRPELVLKGIILDSFGEYTAYIEIDNQKALPMRRGDKTNDVEAVDITERSVMLKWMAESINLSLGKVKTIERPGVRK